MPFFALIRTLFMDTVFDAFGKDRVVFVEFGSFSALLIGIEAWVRGKILIVEHVQIAPT